MYLASIYHSIWYLMIRTVLSKQWSQYSAAWKQIQDFLNISPCIVVGDTVAVNVLWKHFLGTFQRPKNIQKTILKTLRSIFCSYSDMRWGAKVAKLSMIHAYQRGWYALWGLFFGYQMYYAYQPFLYIPNFLCISNIIDAYQMIRI